MFAKVFGQIFDSSIAEDYNCRRMFMDLLVLADSDGVVDMTLEAISRRTNVPLPEVTKYLAELQKPDTTSRSKSDEGKRITAIDSQRGWGWQIVNYGHYRKIRDEEARRSYFRDAKRKLRKANKKASLVQDKPVDNGGLSGQVLTPASASPSSSVSDSLSSFPEEFRKEWSHFVDHRKKKRAPMTDRSQELLLKTLMERPTSALSAVQMAITRNWTGFQWEWFDNDKAKHNANGTNGSSELHAKKNPKYGW